MNEQKIIPTFFLLCVLAISFGIWQYAKIKPQKDVDNVIKIGTAAEFPPFEFIKDDEIVGFDIDLIGQIAQRLGKKIQIQDLSFTTLIPQLQLGSIDLVAAGMTPTTERSKEVLFSENYLTGDPLLIVSIAGKPKIESLNDLKSKKVIVNEGFSADLYMSDIKNVELKRLPTVADAFMSLRAGNGDAFVTARATLQPFFDQYDKKEFSIYEIPDTNEPAAFAISKKRPDLVEAINKVIKEMEKDSTIKTLKQKWNLL